MELGEKASGKLRQVFPEGGGGGSPARPHRHDPPATPPLHSPRCIITALSFAVCPWRQFSKIFHSFSPVFPPQLLTLISSNAKREVQAEKAKQRKSELKQKDQLKRENLGFACV